MSKYKVVIVLFIYVSYTNKICLYQGCHWGSTPSRCQKPNIKIGKIPKVYKNKVKAKSTNQILLGPEKYW